MSRRAVLGAAAALAACDRQALGQDRGVPPALKDLADFPVGCCAMTAQLADPAYSILFLRHFSQLTPEWEMKMEYILQADGSFRWAAPDALAAYARENGLKLFGTTLVWYSQDSEAFRRLEGDRRAFASAYRNYILAVAGRYRGQARGWDVVNEPVAEDGEGFRDCLWSQNLGMEDYMVRAFEHAKEADPDAVLFLNEYNLESLPKKRATFMRLVERLLARGAPIGGLGTQTHLAVSNRPGQVTTAIKELAGFGLPIHVSELDVTYDAGRSPLRPLNGAERQAALVAETAEAFLALPAAQRFGFTLWGLRDQDSWLRKEQTSDRPLLFDDQGEPKPAFWALVDTLSGDFTNPQSAPR